MLKNLLYHLRHENSIIRTMGFKLAVLNSFVKLDKNKTMWKKNRNTVEIVSFRISVHLYASACISLIDDQINLLFKRMSWAP